jgi:plastocyanin
MNVRSGLRGLLLGLVFLPALGVAGTIVGKVVLDGVAAPSKKVEVTIDQYLCGKEKEAEDLVVSRRSEIANAVVWIENAPADTPWPAGAEKTAIDQNGCTFLPRVAIVRAGGTVDFLNSDRLLHNIHAMPKLNAGFNRTQPKNRTVPVTFSKPEIVRVDCDLHSWMTAWVVVAAHPFYAVTNSDGQFSFDKLPAGSYRLQIWHERLGTLERKVTVPEKGDATVTVEMKPR